MVDENSKPKTKDNKNKKAKKKKSSPTRRFFFVTFKNSFAPFKRVRVQTKAHSLVPPPT